jgi:uncharacterized protein
MIKEKVLITGASGSLAKRVKRNLLALGFDVITLTTHSKSVDNSTVFYWNTSEGTLDDEALKGCDHIIHLAGYSIVKPWTAKNRHLMYESRINASNLIFKRCKTLGVKPKTFISASAMGYYGLDAKELKSESDKPANDWISAMCVDWENAANQFEKIGSRVVQMRISLLLTKDAGFLQPTILSMRLGMGVVFGKGNQPIEWIHIDDAARFVSFAIENTAVNGPYNMASNQKFNQYDFMKLIKNKVAKYALLIKLPQWFLSIIFGQRSAILVGGCALSVDKLINSNFTFKYPTLESAIAKEIN